MSYLGKLVTTLPTKGMPILSNNPYLTLMIVDSLVHLLMTILVSN